MITRKLILLICIIILIVSSSYAEDKELLDTTLKGIASDLAQLQKEIENAYIQQAGIYPYTHHLAPFPNYVKITNEKGKLRTGADYSAPILMNASKGALYKVIDKVGNWYAVALPKPKEGIESAWVSTTDVTPLISPVQTGYAKQSIIEKMYEKIMESVKKIRDKYQNNPYVSVSGFSIDIGMPPSVSVSFKFK